MHGLPHVGSWAIGISGYTSRLVEGLARKEIIGVADKE